jgi:hypothetical protein
VPWLDVGIALLVVSLVAMLGAGLLILPGTAADRAPAMAVERT